MENKGFSSFRPDWLDNMTQSIASNMVSLFQSEQISQMLRTSFTSQITDIISSYSKVLSDENLTSINALLDSVESIIDPLNQSISSLPIDVLSECAINALNNALQYAKNNGSDKNLIDKIQTAQPEIETIKHQPITFDRICNIINLLIAILGLLIALHPSDQLDRIIEQNEQMLTQNEQIIKQQSELIALSQEDEILRDTLNDLAESINAFSDVAQILIDESEEPNDLVEPNTQIEKADSQQECADTEHPKIED